MSNNSFVQGVDDFLSGDQPTEEPKQEETQVPAEEEQQEENLEVAEEVVEEVEEVEGTPDVEEGDDTENKEKPKKKRHRNEERFAKFKKIQEEQKAENQYLKEQLSHLQRQFSENKAETEKTGWAAVSTDQLAKVVIDDTGNVSQDQKARALQELTSRSSQEKFDELKTANELRDRQVASWNIVADELRSKSIDDTDFDLSNRDSRLMQMANEVFADLSADPSFVGNPNNQGIALERAIAKLATEKYVDSKGSNEQLKKTARKSTKRNAKQATLESGRAGSPATHKQDLADFVAGNKSLKSVLAGRIDIPE